MHGIAKAVEQQALVALVGSGLLSLSPPSREVRVLGALSTLLGVIGLVYLVFAFHGWAVATYGQQQADLITAGIAIGVSLLTAAAAYLVSKYRKSRVAKLKEDLQEKIMAAAETIAEELEDPVSRNPKMAVALASLAGYVIADRLK